MKVVSQPVDAVAIFRGLSRPIPYKFRYSTGDGGVRVIPVGKIIFMDERKIAGNKSIVYECQSMVDGVERRYQLKYLVSDCRWELYKI